MTRRYEGVRGLELRLEEALATIRELQTENQRLKAGGQSAIAPTNAQPGPAVDAGPTISRLSAEAEKVALFRSLFQGREDVYAYRWDGRDGRSGYSPALRPGAARRKGERPDPSTLLRLDDHVIQSHLRGQRIIGVYPLLEDETCRFLAIDFDKSTWQDDIRELMAACNELAIPASVERSRSGRGGHVWIFFDAPVAAVTARNLGCALLTRALDHRDQLRFDSYDRLFPSQDTMLKGGFGNLIALPLQRVARSGGNTVFLDRDFQPHEDQWHFLASVQRLAATECERIVREAARGGRIMGIDASWFESPAEAQEPWRLRPSRRHRDSPVPGPLPAKVDVVLANRVFISRAGLPPALISRVKRLAAFQNPEFYRRQAMRLWTGNEPRVIDWSEDFPEHVALPRGSLGELLKLFEHNGVWVDVRDERQAGTDIDITFHGELTPAQLVAAEAMLAQDIGVLAAPTAFGKTVIGAWLIARRQVNTLVLVHRQQLADQWRERLAAFLEIEPKSIGQFGAGRNKGRGTIDIGMLQSLSVRGEVKDLVGEYGHVLVDECHHVSAVSFDAVLREVRAKYVTGLTATVARKDGREPIVVMQCGPIRHRIDARKEAEARPFEHLVVPRATKFTLAAEPLEPGIQALYSCLVADQARTEMIVKDVLESVGGGGSPLVLTERTAHLAQIGELLRPHVDHLVVLQGGMGVGERKAVMASLKAIPDDAPRVLLATGRYIGEGFDDARLDTLFLALPVSWRGTIQQYAGRLHRLHARKRKVTVVDYVDVHIPMLARMYQRRVRGYEAIGYSVLSLSNR